MDVLLRRARAAKSALEGAEILISGHRASSSGWSEDEDRLIRRELNALLAQAEFEREAVLVESADEFELVDEAQSTRQVSPLDMWKILHPIPQKDESVVETQSNDKNNSNNSGNNNSNRLDDDGFVVVDDDQMRRIDDSSGDWFVMDKHSEKTDDQSSTLSAANGPVSLIARCAVDNCTDWAVAASLCEECSAKRYCTAHLYFMQSSLCMDCHMLTTQSVGSTRSKRKMFEFCRASFVESYWDSLQHVRKRLTAKVVTGEPRRALSSSLINLLRKKRICSFCMQSGSGSGCDICGADSKDGEQSQRFCCKDCLVDSFSIDTFAVLGDSQSLTQTNVGACCPFCVSVMERRQRAVVRAASPASPLDPVFVSFSTAKTQIEATLADLKRLRALDKIKPEEEAACCAKIEALFRDLAIAGRQIKESKANYPNDPLVNALAVAVSDKYSEFYSQFKGGRKEEEEETQ